MRIAIVYAAHAKHKQSIQEVAKSFSRFFQSKGYFIDSIDCQNDRGKKLTGYQYIIVISHAVSFYGKEIVPSLREFLVESGELMGKRSCVILMRFFQLSVQKAYLALMKCVESYGIVLHYSQVVSSVKVIPSVADRVQRSLLRT